MRAEKAIRVEVVAAWPDHQVLTAVRLPAGATATDAVRAAGLDREFPGIDVDRVDLAIWGQVVDGGQCLRDGDRVEVLRPLTLDPRDARRERASASEFTGRGRARDDA